MKRIFALTLALAMVLSLAACGGKTTDQPSSNNTIPTTQNDLGTDGSVSEPDVEQNRELSEDENILIDLVTAYCYELYLTDGDEEALKYITSDEGISNFAQGLPDEDSALAAAKLLSKYAMELFSTLDPDSPENIVYPGGWDAFYSEYLAFKLDASAAIAVVDTVEEVFQTVAVSENMIYNENGVEFVFAGCMVEGDQIWFNFHLSNQNPDNKKVFVSFNSVSADGFELENGTMLEFNSRNPAAEGIAVGEEADISCVGHTYQFENVLEKLGETIETMPLGTLSFCYDFKIGSDSEYEKKLSELKTSLYREGDIEAFRGTYVGSATAGSNSIDVYTKSGSFGITSIAVNTGEDNYGGFIHTFVNGKPADELNAIPNTMTGVYPGGSIIVFHTDKTDEELRKEYEIGSSEILEITVAYGDTSVLVYSK